MKTKEELLDLAKKCKIYEVTEDCTLVTDEDERFKIEKGSYVLALDIMKSFQENNKYSLETSCIYPDKMIYGKIKTNLLKEVDLNKMLSDEKDDNKDGEQ